MTEDVIRIINYLIERIRTAWEDERLRRGGVAALEILKLMLRVQKTNIKFACPPGTCAHSNPVRRWKTNFEP